MKRSVPVLLFAMALGITGHCFAASNAAVLRGVVRDAHGVAQMGALIELLSVDAGTVSTAYTDDHGRYIMAAVLPGRYQLRATAAFLLPVTRGNLRLQAGAEAVVNLTMNTLFEAESWLPAQKRRADEPVDDWKWTLRSTPGRPLLRLVDQDDKTTRISSSATEAHTAVTQTRVSVTSGDGAFAQGGLHQVLLLNRSMETNDSAILRMDIGDPPAGYPVMPSMEASAGYERRSPMGGNTRLVSSFQSHPELVYGAGAGVQVLRLASTQQISLGDTVMIDAGTLMKAERLAATRFNAEPFLRVMVRPSDDLMIEYRYAQGRTLQGSDDLDKIKPPADVLTDAAGTPLASKGSHHELSVSHKLGARTLAAAAYTDTFNNASITGNGVVNAANLLNASMVSDPTTGSFRLAAAGYVAHGASVSIVQPLTSSLAAWGEYDFGTALWSTLGPAAMLSQLSTATGRHNAQAASAAIRGKIVKSGTSLKAQYRWQPMRTLTQVNAYNAGQDEAYLGFYVRQRIWWGRFLPEGVDAVVEATNLLAQGYQPVIGADGQTLFLAQVTRAVRGGLAFNF